jgi:hypothetical protein
MIQNENITHGTHRIRLLHFYSAFDPAFSVSINPYPFSFQIQTYGHHQPPVGQTHVYPCISSL